jgi:hypothetical protein
MTLRPMEASHSARQVGVNTVIPNIEGSTLELPPKG